VTVYVIETKFNTTMHTYTILLCTGQSDNAFVFHDNFCCLTKRRKNDKKKNEETKPIFEGSYLGNALCDLVEI